MNKRKQPPVVIVVREKPRTYSPAKPPRPARLTILKMRRGR